jgi:hypothetical protein
MAAEKKSKRSKAMRKIRVQDFIIDYPRVQRRKPSKAKIMEIVDNFDERWLGVFHANQREDGTISLLDGQRRRAALIAMGREEYRVQTELHYGLSISEEAAMFRKLNAQRQVGSIPDFLNGVTEGDPKIVQIVDVCREHGWEVGEHQTASSTNSVIGLMRAWDRDGTGEILGLTLSTLNKSFGRDRRTTSGNLLKGCSLFITGVDGKLAQDRLVRNIKKRFQRPDLLIKQGREYAHIEECSTERGIAHIIEKTYRIGCRRKG